MMGFRSLKDILVHAYADGLNKAIDHRRRVRLRDTFLSDGGDGGKDEEKETGDVGVDAKRWPMKIASISASQ